ncbi:MAG: IS1595 family transposase [Pseudomonadota bacterium]
MAQPFSQCKRYRDLTYAAIYKLTEEEACEKFTLMRWGSLTRMPCPECGAIDTHYPRRQRRQWRCKHCDHVFSVMTGTPFSNHKLPYKTLLLLIYEFVSSPKGCSANALHARLGITYRSAYHNLSKLREALYEQANLTPLTGTVHIDGGHFCGKPRRPRKRTKATSSMVNNKLRNRKAGMVPNGMTHLESWNQEKFKNRRIVLTMRQLSLVPGYGAERTIVRIVMAENAKHVLPVIKKYVSPGATIQTDEGHAYANLTAWYNHEAVRHSEQYSSDTGVNNNQAESYFGRMRRAEYGTYHGMRPQYLALYASEFAWREDTRRLSLGQKFDDILGTVLRCGLSKVWRGYYQGHRLGFEYLG